MPQIVHVESVELPELQPFRIARHSSELQTEGLFVAEGMKIVLRLVESPLHVKAILTVPSALEILQPVLHDVRFKEVILYVVDKRITEEIVGYGIHQGVLALGVVPHDLDLSDLNGSVDQVIMVLDGVINADNVGVMSRNCAGLGATALMVGNSSASPYFRRAVRSSMGTVFKLPIIHAQRLYEAVRTLKFEKGFRIVAADASASVSLVNSDLRGNVCLVLGNEDRGLSPEMRELCSEIVSIPMQRGVDSLNVANAGALFLYEALRQRQISGR